MKSKGGLHIYWWNSINVLPVARAEAFQSDVGNLGSVVLLEPDKLTKELLNLKYFLQGSVYSSSATTQGIVLLYA